MRKVLLTILVFFPVLALAGGPDPWCLVRDEVEICQFKTKEACWDGVAANGGSCRRNHEQMGVTGKSQWCVITDAKKDCRYTRGRCLKVAQSVGGGCVENTELALALSRFGDGQFEFASFQDQVEFELRSRSGDLGGKEGEQVILKDDD